jgi:hypothetical protein
MIIENCSERFVSDLSLWSRSADLNWMLLFVTRSPRNEILPISTKFKNSKDKRCQVTTITCIQTVLYLLVIAILSIYTHTS